MWHFDIYSFFIYFMGVYILFLNQIISTKCHEIVGRKTPHCHNKGKKQYEAQLWKPRRNHWKKKKTKKGQGQQAIYDSLFLFCLAHIKMSPCFFMENKKKTEKPSSD